MKLLAAIACLLCASAVNAATATINWTLPTSYTDGSALVVADVASVTLEWSDGLTFGTVAGSQVIVGSATTVTRVQPPGSRCYRAFVTVVAAKGGQSSVPSNASCKLVPFPSPNPPTIIDIIIAWLKAHFPRFA
jgi:hypothetical protein